MPLGLVVPLYNEEDRVGQFGPQLVAFIARHGPGSHLALVDDGSTDSTVAKVEDLMAMTPPGTVHLLRRPHRGKGAAVAAGIAALDTPTIAFCDIDLSTPLGDLDRLVATSRRAPVLAIGSRDLTASTLVRPEGRIREMLGRGYNRLLQATVTPGVVDTQCGAKAASREVWKRILPLCRQQGFAWDAEVVAVALALGIAVQEVPVAWTHDDRSRVRVGPDGLRMVAATPQVWRSAHRARRQATSAPRPSPSGPGESTLTAGLVAADAVDHWWMRSKAALVATALRRTVPSGPDASAGLLVDVGAGPGTVSRWLGWHPDRLVTIDPVRELATLARRRHGLTAAVALTSALPLRSGAAAVVCLLDVIEHLEDPEAGVREAARLLAPGGRLMVTVPAHPRLWGRSDDELGHVRRFTEATLTETLAGAGVEPVLLTHVFSWLLLPAFLTRRWSARRRLALMPRVPALDTAVLALTAVERLLLGRMSLPAGTSLLCVCRTVPSEADQG